MKGRPRNPTVDAQLLEATVNLLATEGYEATSIDAVAKATGVSRPTVYRRFANRAELVEHAAEHVFNEMAPPVRSSDSALDEVMALLENTIAVLTETPAGAVFRNLIPYLSKEPAMGKHANAIGASRRRRLKTAILQAIERGELAAPQNVDVWLDGILGAIYFRFLITGRSLNQHYVEQLLHAR